MEHIKRLMLMAVMALASLPAFAADKGFPRTSLIPPAGDFVYGPRLSGCYLGAGLGLVQSSNRLSIDDAGFGTLVDIDSVGSSGTGISLRAGCDMQMGALVIGAFADHSWVAGGKTKATLFGDRATLSADRELLIAGRIGLSPLPGAMFYGLAGWSQLNQGDLVIGADRASFADPQGIALGGGVDVTIGRGVTGSLEYRRTTYDTQRGDIVPGVVSAHIEPTVSTVRAGINYKIFPR